jgi:N-acetylneuraminate synthase
MQKESIYIIGEAGVNHNGSLDRAKELVRVAAAAGVDAVKFQTFRAEALVTRSAPKAEYQARNTQDDGSQYEMLRALQLSEPDHEALLELCKELNVEFLSTPFDVASAQFLARLGVRRFKVSSGDLTNAPLLLELAQWRLPIILSTGMSTLGEIEQALSVLAFGYTHCRGEKPASDAVFRAFTSQAGQEALRKNVLLLQCTSEYPAPFDSINLRAMDTIHSAFRIAVGFSDHSEGIAIPIAAAARGAKVIEKHFTLSRELPGPDHKASLEPDELTQMVRSIRQVEQALGSGAKMPHAGELKTKAVAAKSLVALKAIKEGEVFSEENLTVKRPGNGMAPIMYWEMLGKKADRNYNPDELITTSLQLTVATK